MTQRRSSQSTSENRTNVSPQAESIHAANYISHHSDLLHMVEKLNVPYGTSWKLRRMSSISNNDDVKLEVNPVHDF
jgi:hypothetical protein